MTTEKKCYVLRDDKEVGWCQTHKRWSDTCEALADQKAKILEIMRTCFPRDWSDGDMLNEPFWKAVKSIKAI